MTTMAFIPARGGSKGIPRKNLAMLNGKPLIWYTLQAARQSTKLDVIFVSSEDPEIIAYCTSLGIEVPYVRPNELAADNSSLIDTVIHALCWQRENNISVPDTIVLLQPTSPLRTARDIDRAITQFEANGAETLASVNEMVEHPYECITPEGSTWRFLAKPAREVYRRQDYSDTFYYLNGAIYIAKTAFLEKEKKFIVESKTDLHIMDTANGIDIDYDFQLKAADALLSARPRENDSDIADQL